jgi:hypothetical protein
MQHRPTLESSKIQMLLTLRRREGTLFSGMPSEIICKISGYSLEDNWRDYEVGLHYIVNGKLKELKALLEAKPFLVLFDGKGSSVTTPRGTTLTDHSFYICAIKEGDPNIKPYIESVFFKVKGGEELMMAQFKYIQTLPCEQPDDLTWLFDAIVESSMDDVEAELKTGKDYDWDYCSPSRQGRGYGGSDLREALNKFREKERARTCSTLNSSDMQNNDQRIDQVYTLLALYENRLIVGNNYNKLRLACRQILGLRQLLNCSGYDRIVFASGQINQATKGEEINRDTAYNYKYPDQVVGTSFPAFNIDLIHSHSGLGFDFCISICEGARLLAAVAYGGFKIYVEQKHQACNRTLCSSHQSTIRQGV